MKWMHNCRYAAWALLALAGFSSAPALAGTVINTGLPSGTLIVNIDGRADGAGAWSGDGYQPYWQQPFANAPSVTLAAGTYQFRVIDPGDAAAAYAGLSPSQLAQIYTGWTFNSPWTTNYMVFDSSALSNSAESQLFDGALAPGNPGQLTYGSAQDAYDAVVANGYYNLIRPAPPGRDGVAADYLTQFTLSTETTLLFVVPDYALGDNNGGVSVVITALAVPEPPRAAEVGLGLGALFFWQRRRRGLKT